jgi:hypothetical protein
LDQLNLGPVPADLKGVRDAPVECEFDQQAANVVTVSFAQ